MIILDLIKYKIKMDINSTEYNDNYYEFWHIDGKYIFLLYKNLEDNDIIRSGHYQSKVWNNSKQRSLPIKNFLEEILK